MPGHDAIGYRHTQSQHEPVVLMHACGLRLFLTCAVAGRGAWCGRGCGGCEQQVRHGVLRQRSSMEECACLCHAAATPCNSECIRPTLIYCQPSTQHTFHSPPNDSVTPSGLDVNLSASAAAAQEASGSTPGRSRAGGRATSANHLLNFQSYSSSNRVRGVRDNPCRVGGGKECFIACASQGPGMAAKENWLG